MSNDAARSFLESLVGYGGDDPVGAADRPTKLGVVDLAYAGVGNPRVKFDGESLMGTRTYVALQPVASGDRVVMLPVGRTYVVLGSVAGAQAAPAVPVGTSIEGHWTAAPAGYLLEDGSIKTRTDYPALFAVIGIRYNTSGETVAQFRLPDSRGRVGVAKSVDVEFDTLGEKGGAKTHVLTNNELPANTYPTSLTVPVVGGAAGSNYFVKTSVTGGGLAHNNIQPYIVVNRAIKY